MADEYMVQIWGGAWNADANPSIEKDLGIKEGYYYFKTEECKNMFCNLLEKSVYKKQGIMINVKYGVMIHKKTIFVGTLKYQGKEFVIHYDFGYEFSEKQAIYMFELGNYSCDCNRSLFIQREYGKNAIPFLGCGNEIKLINFHFEYED